MHPVTSVLLSFPHLGAYEDLSVASARPGHGSLQYPLNSFFLFFLLAEESVYKTRDPKHEVRGAQEVKEDEDTRVDVPIDQVREIILCPVRSLTAAGKYSRSHQNLALRRQPLRTHQWIVYSNCLGKSFHFHTCLKSYLIGLQSTALPSAMCKDESNHQGELQKPEHSV